MIRKADLKDLKSIINLGCIVNDNFNKTYNIEEYLHKDNYIILVSEEKIINGLLIIYNNLDYYELEIIVVDKNSRNKGIATLLFNYFINNYEIKDILLEVNANNTPAINLYNKFNFKIINTRKKYYKDNDAYIMKREVL